MKTKSDGVLVIWDWIWQSFDFNTTDDPLSSEFEDSVDGACNSEHQLSDTEADQGYNLPAPPHTVTFKLIGCTKESQYQTMLTWACC